MTSQRCIAIVDDDESVREAATNLFRSMGLTVVSFSSAEEFLRSTDVERTSCLVLDVQMPGMGGLDLQRQLAASGREIPIVFVTAYPDPAVRDKALKSGAICFLTKPFDEGDLLDGLNTALSSGDHTDGTRVRRPLPYRAAREDFMNTMSTLDDASPFRTCLRRLPTTTRSSAARRRCAMRSIGCSASPVWTPPSSSWARPAPARK